MLGEEGWRHGLQGKLEALIALDDQGGHEGPANALHAHVNGAYGPSNSSPSRGKCLHYRALKGSKLREVEGLEAGVRGRFFQMMDDQVSTGPSPCPQSGSPTTSAP